MSHPSELSDAALAFKLRTERDPERKRAAQLEALRRLPVKPLVGGGYIVASRTTPGAWWLVQLQAEHRPDAPWSWTCTCPAKAPSCWHVRQVGAYCRLSDAMHARPTPPPNVAGLVD